MLLSLLSFNEEQRNPEEVSLVGRAKRPRVNARGGGHDVETRGRGVSGLKVSFALLLSRERNPEEVSLVGRAKRPRVNARGGGHDVETRGRGVSGLNGVICSLVIKRAKSRAGLWSDVPCQLIEAVGHDADARLWGRRGAPEDNFFSVEESFKRNQEL
jgi:hypothetical protein